MDLSWGFRAPLSFVFFAQRCLVALPDAGVEYVSHQPRVLKQRKPLEGVAADAELRGQKRFHLRLSPSRVREGAQGIGQPELPIVSQSPC